MARVVVAPAARDDLRHIIRFLDLSPGTPARVRDRIRTLQRFPLQGAALEGRWEGFRFILGPWSWMLIVYEFHESTDQVNVVTIQDARRATAATAGSANRSDWGSHGDPAAPATPSRRTRGA